MKHQIEFAAGRTTVRFRGAIDERVGEALAEIRPQLKTPAVDFDLAGVELINSIGISTWIAHLEDLRTVRIRYVNAPYAFVALCQIIPVLLDGRTLESFQIRYSCKHCDDGEAQLGLVHRQPTLGAGTFATAPCRRCQKPMETDPHDEDFLALFSAA